MMEREVLDKHGAFLIDYGKKHGIIFRLSRNTFSIEVLDKGDTPQ